MTITTPIKRIRTPKQTRELILDTALKLLNDLSTLAVSTNMIAEEAGLSVGNLYYHFKDRGEIVRALFDRNAAETRVAFTPREGDVIDMDLCEIMMRRNYEILWRYRFLYRELTVLLNRDMVLAKAFREHRQYGMASFAQFRAQFVLAGAMRPSKTAEEEERLAVMVWLVSEYFIQFLEAEKEVKDLDFIEQGILLLRQTLQPYIVEVPN